MAHAIPVLLKLLETGLTRTGLTFEYQPQNNTYRNVYINRETLYFAILSIILHLAIR